MICDGLNERLRSVAEFVRQGAIFADIGTDHAYLPLFLLKTGRISSASCSDINEGPLASARRNAADAGLSERITFTLADGAEALSGRGITDYAICGMGGELIADIIDRAPHLKDGGVNLILQPMTKPAKLRKYLAESGFSILSESYSRDAGKSYVCMLVTYTADVRELNAIDAELGQADTEILNLPAYVMYLKDKICAYERAAEGKLRGGDTAPEELLFINAAKSRLSTIEKLLK